MKKFVALLIVLLVSFALVAGSVAAPGLVMAQEGTSTPIFSLFVPILINASVPGPVSPGLPPTCVPDAGMGEISEFKVISFDTSIGYEDLDLSSPSTDFDYNDWITDIKTDLCFYTIPNLASYLWQLDFIVLPEARGAALDHAYHIDLPANTFPSDGVAILTKYDSAGNVVGTPVEQTFLAGQLNQFTMVDPTSVAIPGSIVNTVETRPYQQPTGFASLSIRFDTPFWFDPRPFEPNQPGNAHGEKLFFQPHLFVYQTPSYEIRPGNPLMLVVPFLTWEWPEERVAIWRAYPDVTPGDMTPNPKVPPQFPDGWFVNFNNCVYDGVLCTAPAAGASAPTLLPYPAP